MNTYLSPSLKKTKKSKKRSPTAVTVNLDNTNYESVRQCCVDLGYKIISSDRKNLLFWCDSGGTLEFASNLETHQFYNHFPGMYSIAHKVDLSRNILRLSRVMPDIYHFHPRTFLLPHQYQELKSTMLGINDRVERTFIIKPDRGAQGKGIFLIQEPEIVANSFMEGNGAVAQQYIKPFLIDGLKFDLRIYILVTSVDPLRVYIHKEGMARFCTEAYNDPCSDNLDHCYSHLTNYSLNKQNDQFNKNNQSKIYRNLIEENHAKPFNRFQDEKSDSDEEEEKISNPEQTTKSKIDKNSTQAEDVFSISHHETPFKRSLSSIMESIRKSGKDADQLQNEIDDIIRFTMASIQPFLSSSYHSVIAVSDGKCRCFEILGFDVLIDHNLKPWLLEVNYMPSLTTDTEFDRILKYSVIKGALKIVDIKPDFKKLLKTRQKNISQGKKKVPLYDPEIEFKIAKENTNWRQLLPIEIPPENEFQNFDSSEACEISKFDAADEKITLTRKRLLKLKSNYEKALRFSRDSPLGAAAATSASKAKMMATRLEIKERKKRFSIPQTVRNSAVVLKNPLPPLHGIPSCFSPKHQKISLNQLQQQQNEDQIKTNKMKSDSISNSKSEVINISMRLTSNIALNMSNKIGFEKNTSQSNNLESSISISNFTQEEKHSYPTKMPNMKMPQKAMETKTSGEMPLFLHFSGANQNQFDTFEEEQRVNTLKERREEEKSLGITNEVYKMLGIQVKKDSLPKYTNASKKLTKPIVAFRQIFNEKVVI